MSWYKTAKLIEEEQSNTEDSRPLVHKCCYQYCNQWKTDSGWKNHTLDEMDMDEFKTVLDIITKKKDVNIGHGYCPEHFEMEMTKCTKR